MFDTIQLQAYALHPNLQVEVFQYEYPKQWVESFQTVQLALGKEKRFLPFKKIKEFLFSWQTDILYVNDFSNTFRDTSWILSTAQIEKEYLYEIFHNCLSIAVEQIQNVYAKELFSKWVKNLAMSDLTPPVKTIISLTTDTQYIADNRAYQIIPRWIYQQLTLEPLELEGKRLIFKPTDIGLISDPTSLSYEAKKNRNYYSLKIVADIQTTPHNRKPMLQFTYMITRWMDRRIPLDSWNESNTSVYVEVDNRLVKLEIVKKKKELHWEPLLKEMYQSVYFGKPLPMIEELVQEPREYKSFHIVYRLEFGNPIPVGAGESMRDRYILKGWIENKISHMLQPLPTLERGKSVIGQVKRTVIKTNLLSPEMVQEVLSTAIGQRKLNLEVYYMGENERLLEPIKYAFIESLGIDEGTLNTDKLEVSISYIQQNELLAQVDALKTEKERHEEKINQIQQVLPQAQEVTACLVLLPFTTENGQLYYKAKEDPKKAIRAGFASTGRLTQFIDSTNPDSIEHRVKTAMYDLYRQLGYVDPFNSKKYKTVNYNTAVSAMHIVNFKKTPYGHTKRAMIWLVRSENRGPIMVECPALWEGQKYYWQACLAFQQVATLEGYRKFRTERIIRDIKDKLYNLHYKKENPHLFMISSDGVSRKEWPFLTDVTLSSVEKDGPFTLKNIWFEKGKENEGLVISKDNQLRIVRVRINDEVPDYLTPLNDKGNYQTKSAIFRFGEVFYSIAEKPVNRDFSAAVQYDNSKLLERSANKAFKFSNLVELYPIHLQPNDDPEEWISLTHNYRNLAHQFKETLRSPLLLHMASLLEEYIY